MSECPQEREIVLWPYCLMTEKYDKRALGLLPSPLLILIRRMKQDTLDRLSDLVWLSSLSLPVRTAQK